MIEFNSIPRHIPSTHTHTYNPTHLQHNESATSLNSTSVTTPTHLLVLLLFG